jgi:dipeptidase
MKLPLGLSLTLALLALPQTARVTDACTVIAVGAKASVDGSTFVAHTDDAGGGTGDVRLVRVPAQRHASDAQRAVYNFNGGFPRLVSHERGPIYAPRDASQVLTPPMGFIPQVPHTYAYWDQDYGMMNEVQLSIGESTCGAKTAGWPLDAGPHGKNLFSIAELTKVALERCDSARCAVETMGELAVTHGFYSEDSGDQNAPDYGDSAEALSIADRHGEVWVFHVMTGPKNASAVWAAQRVPDDHVTALANGFSIREMDLSRSDWFLASANVQSFAQDMGWWDGTTAFDFTAAYGFADKDAVGPLYTGRRLWRIFDVLAPSLRLDARLGSFSQYATYPFSVKPDALVDITAIMELLRDHYEGTKYDMTKGIAAGPFGAPVRFGGNPQGVPGGWERPISMHRTLYSFVLQARGALPDAVGGVVWYAQDAPHGSVYVPFSCRQDEVPESYTTGKQSEFSTKSAWWAFNFVNNWSLLRFNAINAEVRSHIRALESISLMRRQTTEYRALEMLQEARASGEAQVAVDQFVQAQSNAFAEEVVAHWWSLAWTLVAKYSNGYVTTGEKPTEMQSPGYPGWWLQISEFAKWPGDSFTPRDSVKQQLKGLASMATSDATARAPSNGSGFMAILGWVLFGFVMGAGTFGLVQRYRRYGYTTLL